MLTKWSFFGFERRDKSKTRKSNVLAEKVIRLGEVVKA